MYYFNINKQNRIQSKHERKQIVEAIVNYWKAVDVQKLIEEDCRQYYKKGQYAIFKDFYQDFADVYYFNLNADKEEDLLPMRSMGNILLELLHSVDVIDYFFNDQLTDWYLRSIVSDDIEMGNHLCMKDLLNLALEPVDERITLCFNDFVLPCIDIDFSSINETNMKTEEDMVTFFLKTLEKTLSSLFSGMESIPTGDEDRDDLPL